MLISAAHEDIEKYGELAYGLALDPARSCYPTYADGIKTKADFLAAAERALASEMAELLLFIQDGAVEGWLSYFWINEDKYLQLDGCNVRHGTTAALTELLDRLEARFAGYTAYFGFPGENREAADFLRARGFDCVERDWNFSFFFDGYTPAQCARGIEKISRRNFDLFRAVYRAEPDAYWSCDRILDALDDWNIFVYSEGSRPAAAVFFTGGSGYYEIYGTSFADGAFRDAIFRALITAALGECARLGAKYLTCLCGDDERRILPELGFRCVGQYVLYTKELAGSKPRSEDRANV